MKRQQLQGFMMHIAPRSFSAFILALAAAALVSSCEDDPAQPREELNPSLAPNFSLLDVNPKSVRHGESVSPRDYLGKVSAWYFGHAT
jgi:hypothetical protein